MEDVGSLTTDNAVKKLSLWECIHDADLLSLSTDLLNRTVTIAIRVFYINQFHHLPEDTTFSFMLKDVRAVSAMRLNPWPGLQDIPFTLPWEEQQALRHQFYEKGRMESFSWITVEQVILPANNTEIMNGSIATDELGKSVLELEAYFRDPGEEEYLHLKFECSEVVISRPDNQPMRVHEFLALGEAYWKAFAARGSDSQPQA